MSIAKAKSHYAGKDGCKKLNCAQSIISAFKEKCALDDNIMTLFASYGAGRAPGGECGALYAAKYILALKHRDRIENLEEAFLSCAGSTKCRQIRSIKRLPCLGCVEKAAEFLENI